MKLTLRHLIILCVVGAVGYLTGWLSSKNVPSRSFTSAPHSTSSPEQKTPSSLPSGYFAYEEDKVETTPTRPPRHQQPPVEITTPIEPVSPPKKIDLREAILANNTDQVKELLQQDIWISPNLWEDTIRRGNTDILSLLLEKQPEAVNQSLTMAITHSHQMEIFQLLADKGAELGVSPDGAAETPLLQAAAKGNHTAIQFLLEKGADVKQLDDVGRTALMLAANAETLQTVSNQVSQSPTQENTARLIQLQQQYKTILQLLLQHGAGVNATDNQGFTALMWAALSGNASLAEVLLQNKAAVNLKATDGRTALSMAVEERHPEVVQLLLTHGADANAKVSFYLEDTKQIVKMRPLAYARSVQYADILALLEKTGAEE